MTVSSDGATPSTVRVFTESRLLARDAYPIAPGFCATAVMTAPVDVSSWLYLQTSSVPVMDSKPSLVPEPASLPTGTTGASGPPTESCNLLNREVRDCVVAIDDDSNSIKSNDCLLEA